MNLSFVSRASQSIIHNFKDKIGIPLNAQQKKVALFVSAIFSALAIICFFCFYKSKPKNLEIVQDKKVELQNLKIKLNNLINESRDLILFEMNAARAMQFIQSAKFFIDIKDKNDQAIIEKEYIVKKVNGACFDDKFLSQEINSMFDDIKKSKNLEQIPNIGISIEIIIKDKFSRFYEAHVNINDNSPHTEGHSDISDGTIAEFWKVGNKGNKPLLNDQMEFI